MPMGLPPEIIGKRLVQDGCGMRLIHRRVMLKTLAANIAHQSLQILDFHHRPAAESIQRIIHKLPVAHIAANDSMAVIRGDSRIAKGTLRSPPGYGSVGILRAQSGGKYFRVGHLHLTKKAFCPIAAMEHHALIRVIAVVVIPID